MRKLAVFTLGVLCAFLSCSDEPSAPEETISRPNTPAGDSDVYVDSLNIFKTVGAASSMGHPLQHRFDFDAAGGHDYTDWSYFDSVTVSWPDTGLYVIKAQARCFEHNDKISEWSQGKDVVVTEGGEAVTPPLQETGTPEAQSGTAYTFCTSGAASTWGHALEYQFDFDADGAHATTAWDAATCVDHTWTIAGPYIVKSRARCAEHKDVVSAWSRGKPVNVDYEIISGPTNISGSWSALVNVSESYCVSDAMSSERHSLEFQFDFDADGSGTITAWDRVPCVSHSWTAPGEYAVKARARCEVHTRWVSAWYDGIRVTVTEVTQLPEIRFATHIDGVSNPYTGLSPLDTVGALQPFSISYHGLTVNGSIVAYWFMSLATGFDIEGSGVWYDDLADTLRTFPNTGPDMVPSGDFALGARCRDSAGAETPYAPVTYQDGVCQVVVNFDPDTRITDVLNSYIVDHVPYQQPIDFNDGIPDTVPLGSWVQLGYEGWDDGRDGKIGCSDLETDRCVGFQAAYWKESARIPGAEEFSLWQPRFGLHDTDPFTSADSNSFNIASLEYELSVRAVDEHARPDGTPPSVDIIGNFDPILDSVAVEDNFGERLDLSGVDTLTWNFWKGDGWPYTTALDTIEVTPAGANYYKRFSFGIMGWGHDHPRDPDGSGVKSWRYMVTNSSGAFVNIGRANIGFVGGAELNVLDDGIALTFRYPIDDPMGDTVFDNLPAWFNDDLTLVLTGRDTSAAEPAFTQYIFIDGQQTLLNVFTSAVLGRWTQERSFTFQVRLIR
jgi:hypothetical protein